MIVVLERIDKIYILLKEVLVFIEDFEEKVCFVFNVIVYR